MSSPGPPPAAPTFEASKCAWIMARTLASSIENLLPGRGLVPGAGLSGRGDLTVQRLQHGDGHEAEAASEGAPHVSLRRRARDASWLRGSLVRRSLLLSPERGSATRQRRSERIPTEARTPALVGHDRLVAVG